MSTWLITNLMILTSFVLCTWRGFAVVTANNRSSLFWLMLASVLLVIDIISEALRGIIT